MVLVAWVDCLWKIIPLNLPMRNTLILLVLLYSFSGFSQESIIKDFAENRRDIKVCLYPSTLRMINIKKDPAFYEMVNDVEKLLIYIMDSGTSSDDSYTDWTNDYRALGYEEYIAMTGKVNLIILGKEEEYVGVSGGDGRVAAFYLRGAIAFQKIPKLIETFESGDMLTLLQRNLDR